VRIAPVNLADLASARPSGDLHLHGGGLRGASYRWGSLTMPIHFCFPFLFSGQ
jgi:hypothetical protein